MMYERHALCIVRLETNETQPEQPTGTSTANLAYCCRLVTTQNQQPDNFNFFALCQGCFRVSGCGDDGPAPEETARAIRGRFLPKVPDSTVQVSASCFGDL